MLAGSWNAGPEMMDVVDEPFLQAMLDGDEERAIELAEKVIEGTHYMQTKRAVNYWMRRNAMAYGRDGIRMNGVAPGPTITPMTRDITAAARPIVMETWPPAIIAASMSRPK